MNLRWVLVSSTGVKAVSYFLISKTLPAIPIQKINHIKQRMLIISEKEVEFRVKLALS